MESPESVSELLTVLLHHLSEHSGIIGAQQENHQDLSLTQDTHII